MSVFFVINITNRKRLPWCELINPYNFFSLSIPRLLRVSVASRSRPASRKLQCLVSDKILNDSVSEIWVLGLGSEGLVHIPAQMS